MSTGTIFTMGSEQFVRLPAVARLSDSVNRVDVRVVGPDRVLSPAGKGWDSFFDNAALQASPDFLSDREARWQDERDASER